MKIRIKGNSLRYRLSKSEVDIVANSGYLQERIEFMNNALFYGVRSTRDANMSAQFIDNRMTLICTKKIVTGMGGVKPGGA